MQTLKKTPKQKRKSPSLKVKQTLKKISKKRR